MDRSAFLFSFFTYAFYINNAFQRTTTLILLFSLKGSHRSPCGWSAGQVYIF